MITFKTIFAAVAIATGIALATNEPESLPRPSVEKPMQIVNGFDGSGTVKGKGWKWPGKEYYEEQITLLEHHQGGVIEVYNFSQAIPTPIVLKIEALKEVPSVYAGETEVKRIKQENENILKRNSTQKAAFWARMEDEMLNYKPSKVSDFSFVQNNVSAINKTLRLPQYSNFQRCLLIYSDMLNDEPGKFPKVLDSTSVKRLNDSGAAIAICSFISNAATDGLKGTQVKSPEDFNGIINSFFRN